MSIARFAALWLVLASTEAHGAAAVTIRKAILFKDEQTVRLTFGDGHVRTVQANHHEVIGGLAGCFEGQGCGARFGPPAIVGHRRMALWSVEQFVNGSYRIPVAVLAGQRHRLATLTCEQGTPLDWRLASATRIVMTCAFPYGPELPVRQLHDSCSGQLLASHDMESEGRVPAWARDPKPAPVPDSSNGEMAEPKPTRVVTLDEYHTTVVAAARGLPTGKAGGDHHRAIGRRPRP